MLSPDGRRAVSIEFGRATVMDVPSLGIAAVLGPPSLPEASRPARPINHLALSRDGSLLVSNVLSFAAFALQGRPALRRLEGRLERRRGDQPGGRCQRRRQDRRASPATGASSTAAWMDGSSGSHHRRPPRVGSDLCLPIRLRFSPKMTWLAGNNYSRVLDVFDVRDLSRGTPPVPLVNLPAGCDAVAFSRDDRLMATSGAALYRTAPNADGWRKLWSAVVPAPPEDDLHHRRIGERRVVQPGRDGSCSCRAARRPARAAWSVSSASTRGRSCAGCPSCSRRIRRSRRTGAGSSPAGPCSTFRRATCASSIPAVATTTALFTPDGDIIAGSADDVLTRYCRSR